MTHALAVTKNVYWHLIMIHFIACLSKTKLAFLITFYYALRLQLIGSKLKTTPFADQTHNLLPDYLSLKIHGWRPIVAVSISHFNNHKFSILIRIPTFECWNKKWCGKMQCVCQVCNVYIARMHTKCLLILYKQIYNAYKINICHKP